jgi:N-acetylglucosamine-6-phosphate deacetylase
VSDAVTALGLEDGNYVLGQMEIEVKGLRAVLAGTNTLCGAIASLFQVYTFTLILLINSITMYVWFLNDF